ncbi:ABC transporter permease [Fodinicola acaciae]|uniref:ABC transporter permease n=1 Tax=Fodinicola acaciae TaxID=2681555 RepID=UPI0013D2F9B6|nr:ABC transporter permease [Fodinicola acaciae]
MAVDSKVELAGLDALELGGGRTTGLGSRLWAASWPKLLAVALVFAAWQLIVWSGLKPDYILPGPAEVFAWLWQNVFTAQFWTAIAITMTRALSGYAVAIVIGAIVGIAVVRVRALRAAIGSLITGLQTLPSIAWFPLAILLFQLSEQTITFVVVLGAAPSIANGLINGVDYVPPLLKRVGTNLGARGLGLYRHVVLPAALPSCVAGLKQGWAFAWRSLMAGELLVIVQGRPSIGAELQHARDQIQPEIVIALLIVILIIGILVDTAFSFADRTLRSRWGLSDTR